jgi:hypothetical protein
MNPDSPYRTTEPLVLAAPERPAFVRVGEAVVAADWIVGTTVDTVTRKDGVVYQVTPAQAEEVRWFMGWTLLRAEQEAP